MSVPNFEDLMLPVLQRAATVDEVNTQAAVETAATHFALTQEDLSRRQSGAGRQTVVTNNASWAMIFLNCAGMLERKSPGLYAITEKGRELLAKQPERIDLQLLGPLPPPKRGSRVWLLSWNPANWEWTTFADDRSRTASGEAVHKTWRCGNKDAKRGDAVYLVRTGSEPRGAIARGKITKDPYQGPHFDPARAAAGETVQVIDVKFDDIRDPSRDPFVSLEELQEAPSVGDQVWNPQRSGIEIKPDAASALEELWNNLPRVAADDTPLPALAEEDFAILERHATPKPWDELTEEDRARYAALRGKLVAYASALANRLRLRTKLVPFTSHPNPNGRNPLYQWCCVFPEVAGEKSYAFQLFLIVRPTHVEVGFASGTGTGGRKKEQERLRRGMEESKQKLLALRGTEAVNETFEAASRVGCLPRPKWLGDADDPALASADEWVSHAASPDGNGAAVSVFWPREQVVGAGGTFFDRLQSTLTIFTPLLDAIYSSIPQSLPRPTIEGLMQETSWPKDRLEELLDALQTTQVVLAGPPGTGKTWVARKVAAYLTNGLADRVTTVQFHPSYGYEEFIEGVRPVVSSSGTLQFDRVDGVVLRLSNFFASRFSRSFPSPQPERPRASSRELVTRSHALRPVLVAASPCRLPALADRLLLPPALATRRRVGAHPSPRADERPRAAGRRRARQRRSSTVSRCAPPIRGYAGL